MSNASCRGVGLELIGAAVSIGLYDPTGSLDDPSGSLNGAGVLSKERCLRVVAGGPS